MTAPFKIETLQQAMRAAWVGAYRGLASQGWEVASDGGACRWRLRRGDRVLCCAVGWLLPDDPRVFAAGDVGVETLFNWPELLAEPLVPWLRDDDFQELLTQLQVAHDGSSGPDDMRVRIENVGVRYGLGPVPSLQAVQS